jgi:hypothetical protein
LALLLVLGVSRASAQCSGERWPVKIGTDADAGKVNLTPNSTTIASLVAQPAPNKLSDNSRQPAEKRPTLSPPL